MNIKEVKDLIQEILLSDISEFELEHTGTKVKLRRGYGQEVATSVPAPVAVSRPAPSAPAPVVATQPATAASENRQQEDGLHFVTSPIVGTFYRASAPGAEAYVKVGDSVEDGTVLCIVEAMKLMNEIPSDIAGEIVQIHVENAHPVEFGQKLFAIRPRT